MKIFTVLALGECPIADGISAVLKSKGYHPLGVSNAYCRSGFNAEAAAEVTNTVRPYQLANTIAVVAVGLEGNMASVLHGFVLIVDAQDDPAAVYRQAKLEFRRNYEWPEEPHQDDGQAPVEALPDRACDGSHLVREDGYDLPVVTAGNHT